MKHLLLLLSLLTGSSAFYNCMAQCATSSTPNLNCYYGDAINSFTLNSISTSGNSGCTNVNTGYSTFSSPVWNLTAGATYSFSANVGNSLYVQGFAIWIDLNNNGQYDAAEQLFTSSSNLNTHTGTITIPSTATTGSLKMRLRCGWNAATISASDACASIGSGYGETEDYSVNIVPACNVAFTTQPQNKSLCSGGNTSFTVAASNANTYKWEVSTNGGTSWAAVANAGVYTGATTATLTITGGTASMSGYLYRAVGTNTTLSCSVNSAVAALYVGNTPSISSTSSAGGCTGSPTSVTAVPSTGAVVQWYDQSAGGTLLGTGNTLSIASAPAANTNYYAQPTIVPAATSLSVQLSATNSNTGCFMDIKPLKDIKMTDISWVPAATQSYDISIYFKSGTSVGFETTSAAWTLLTNKTGISATAGTPNKITLPTAQTLLANNIYSILVIRTGTSGSVAYQTVSALGSVEASNSDLQLMSSSGIGALFTGSLNTPRQLAGIVWYEPVVCTAAARTTVQLIVNAPPAATTNPTSAAVCRDKNITLNTVFTGASTYQWEMSNTGGSSWTNVSNGGIYSGATTNSLTITGVPTSINGYQYRCKGTCTSTTPSAAATITVNEPPSIISQPVNTSVCLGENTTIQCTATGSGTLTYEWQRSLDGGSTWIAVPASAPYSTVNTSTLTITGATTTLNSLHYRCVVKGICTPDATTGEAVLTVDMPPSVISEPVDQDVCPGATAVFSSTVSGTALNYQWQELTTTWSNISNGGSISGATSNILSIADAHTGLAGRKYRCVITGKCTPPDTTVERLLTIKAIPDSVVLLSNSPVCEGKNLQLEAYSKDNGVTFSWTGPNSFGASTQNPAIGSPVVAHTGDFIATLTLTSTGCSVNDTIPVVVKITPSKPVVGSNTPVCTKLDINLTATSTAGSTYSWSGPAGFSSTSQNPVRSTAALHMSGYYRVDATINGCISDPDSTLVAIINSPEVGAFPSPSNIICVGDSITFIGIGNHGGVGPAYQWMKNGVDVQGETALTYKAGGLSNNDIIALKMTPGAGVSCSTSIVSIPIPVTVNPYLPPQVTISADPSTPLWQGLLVTFTATPADAGNAPGYQWKRNGQDVSGATGPTWSATTLNDNDVIACEITSDYLCPSVPTGISNQLKVKVLTSVANLDKNADVTLFPNPNSGSFVLKGNIKSAKVDIEVLNAIGQVVYRETATTNNGKLQQEIRLAELADGIYMVRIHGESEEASIRFKLIN